MSALEEQFSPAELEQLRRGMLWPSYMQHLKIEDRATGQLVPLVLNGVQQKIRNEIERCLVERLPIRIIVLKSRRMGVSTLIQASFAHLAFTTSGFTAWTGAHEERSAKALHAMTEQMHQGLPDPIRPAKDHSERGKILSLVNRSKLTTFTAGGSSDGVGRGAGARAIHASEVAFYPDAASTLLSLRQIVPDEPETFVCLESTANGVGDAFHQEWLAAEAQESGYTPMFFPWFEFAPYRIALHGVPLEESVTLLPTLRPVGAHQDEEAELRRTYGVDDEQIAWRRHTIASKTNRDLRKFHQEYPSTPGEAFLTSGRTFFANLTGISTFIPSRTGEIRYWNAATRRPMREPAPRKGLAVGFRADPFGPLSMWESPRAGHKYVIGADVAGTTLQADYDARPAGEQDDAYCAYVVDVESGREAACFHTHAITEFEYADALAALGYLYGTAEIGVEKQGGYGTATLSRLRDTLHYPRLYEHERADSTDAADRIGSLGFPMSMITRPLVLATLSELIRDAPGCIVDPELLKELRAFVVTRSGKAQAQTGYHDDRVMARALAGHLRQLRAVRPRPAQLAPKRNSNTSIARRAPRFR